jgi:molecular chaperone DnaK (HSP70)
MAHIVAGLDFGNKNCVIAIPHNRGVDVITNGSGKRLTPSMVCYATSRRYYGDFAHAVQIQNPCQTVTDLKKLIHLKWQSDERIALKDVVCYELAELPDGYTGVTIDGEVKRPEEFLAYLLQSLLRLAQTHDSRVSGFTITVSPWWTAHERQAVLDACSIAKIECIALVNSTIAAALSYIAAHRNRLTDSEVHLLLIDFGDSSLNAAVCAITHHNVRIISSCSESLGGSHFTEALARYLHQKIQENHGVDVFATPRSALRFRRAVETAKHNLSINTVVSFELPDQEISFPLHRKEFESQICDFLPRIAKPVESALHLSNIDRLFAVEVLGGASRVPSVKRQLELVLGQDLSQSLNLDECCATGSAYFGAILTPSFRTELSVTPVVPNRITAKWETGSEEIAPSFSLSTEREIRVENCGEIGIYESDVRIGAVKVNGSAALKFGLVMGVELLDGGSLVLSKEFGLSEKEIGECRRNEVVWAEKDERELAIDNSRNELESLLFTVENGVSRDFPECFDPSRIGEIRQGIANVRQWFADHEFERLSYSEYVKKTAELRGFCGSGIELHRIYKRIGDSEAAITARIGDVGERMSGLGKAADGGAREVLEVFRAKVAAEFERVKGIEHWIDPGFSVDEVEAVLRRFECDLERLEQENRRKAGRKCVLV